MFRIQSRFISLFVLLLTVFVGACDQDPAPIFGPDAEATADEQLLAITNVSVLPMDGEALLANQTVLISGGQISQIGATDSVTVPPHALIIEGQGRFLMPGLADMHAHPMRPADLALYLANGVTSVRAMWGEPSLLKLRESIRAGEIPGPRIYTSGRIVGGQPPHHFGTVALGEAEQAAAVIDAQITAGFDFIKVYSLMSPQAFDAIASAADERGVEFSGHVPGQVSMEQALTSSMRTMEHLIGLLNATRNTDIKANIEWRFMDADAAELISELGRGDVAINQLFDRKKRDSLVAKIAADDSWIVPTFSVLRTHEFNELPDEARFLHPSVRFAWETFVPMVRAFTNDKVNGEKALFNYQLELVGDIYRAGGKLLVGTDAPNPGVMTGFAVANEVAFMEQAGLSRLDALRAATLWPAQYLKMSSSYGAVKEGAVADLLLLNANPLEGLDALRNIAMVFRAYEGQRNTKIYDRESLDALLSSVEAGWISLESTFAEEPVLSDPVQPVYSFAGEAQTRLSFVVEADLDRTQVNAAFIPAGGDPAISDQWQRFTLSLIGSTSKLHTEDRSFEVAGESGALLMNGNQIAVTDAMQPGAVLLSRTPADLPVLGAALAGLAIGESRPVDVWLCPEPMDCRDARYAKWRVERLEDSVVDGAFYYTGVQQFAIYEEQRLLGVAYIGGGPFYGGQAVALEVPDWPLSAMTRLR